MQNNKYKNNVFLTIVSFALAAVLFIGTRISATEKGRPQDELTGSNAIPSAEEHQKKEVVQAPATFVPTDEVSADQAVAFPTDI